MAMLPVLHRVRFLVCLVVLIEHRLMPDRRTDRQTDGFSDIILRQHSVARWKLAIKWNLTYIHKYCIRIYDQFNECQVLVSGCPLTVSMLELLVVGVIVQLRSFGGSKNPVRLQHVIGILCFITTVCPFDLYSYVRFHAAASINSV